MKTKIQSLYLIIFFVCICNLGAEQAVYLYKGFDTNGVLVIKGILNLTISETNKISGDWHLQTTSSKTSDEIRNTTDSGKLGGTINDNKIYLNLNPGWSDNNVMLNGNVTTTNISGTWGHYGYAGLTIGGKFEAVKKN